MYFLVATLLLDFSLEHFIRCVADKLFYFHIGMAAILLAPLILLLLCFTFNYSTYVAEMDAVRVAEMDADDRVARMARFRSYQPNSE